MATVRELTDPFVSALTRVPRVGPRICRVCRSVPNGDYEVCYSCMQTCRQVSHPVDVLPISMCEPLGQLHTLLRGYKDNRSDDVRRLGRGRLAAIVTRFLKNHEQCIAPDGWDAITFVPSTSGREGEHPFQQALKLMPRYGTDVERLLEKGPDEIGRIQARDRGFEVIGDVSDRAVLLMDDTFTSGAHVQSAASALRLAGADLVAAVVVGRYFRPEFSEAQGELWKELRREPFDFGICGLE